MQVGGLSSIGLTLTLCKAHTVHKKLFGVCANINKCRKQKLSLFTAVMFLPTYHRQNTIQSIKTIIPKTITSEIVTRPEEQISFSKQAAMMMTTSTPFKLTIKTTIIQMYTYYTRTEGSAFTAK